MIPAGRLYMRLPLVVLALLMTIASGHAQEPAQRAPASLSVVFDDCTEFAGLGSLPAGRLGDLWGRRAMMVVFFFGMGASSVLASLGISFPAFFMGMLLLLVFAVKERIDRRLRVDEQLELVERAERVFPQAVAGVRREEGDRRVSPVVFQPRRGVLLVELKDGHQLDGSDAEVV